MNRDAKEGFVFYIRSRRTKIFYPVHYFSLLIIQLQKAEYLRDGITEAMGLLLDTGKHFLVDSDNICEQVSYANT